jgi:hypothetical protein
VKIKRWKKNNRIAFFAATERVEITFIRQCGLRLIPTTIEIRAKVRRVPFKECSVKGDSRALMRLTLVD